MSSYTINAVNGKTVTIQLDQDVIDRINEFMDQNPKWYWTANHIASTQFDGACVDIRLRDPNDPLNRYITIREFVFNKQFNGKQGPRRYHNADPYDFTRKNYPCERYTPTKYTDLKSYYTQYNSHNTTIKNELSKAEQTIARKMEEINQLKRILQTKEHLTEKDRNAIIDMVFEAS